MGLRQELYGAVAHFSALSALGLLRGSELRFLRDWESLVMVERDVCTYQQRAVSSGPVGVARRTREKRERGNPTRTWIREILRLTKRAPDSPGTFFEYVLYQLSEEYLERKGQRKILELS